jgi:hypothetical protein
MLTREMRSYISKTKYDFKFQAQKTQKMYSNYNLTISIICSKLQNSQICVLLELTYLLTRHFVYIVGVTPLVLRVQVPVHLVQLEESQMNIELCVVMVCALKRSTKLVQSRDLKNFHFYF